MADSKRTEPVTLSLTKDELATLDHASDSMGIPRAIIARVGALEKARRDLAQLDADRDAQRHPQTA